MNPDIRCPCCSMSSRDCPHLLVLVGTQPGQVLGGPLSARMSRMWELITEGVGYDPSGVLEQAWINLRHQVAADADLMIERNGRAAIFVADPTRMEAAVEQCIPLDEV